jgi:hypothetical protein
MHHQILHFLSLRYTAGWALLAAVLLGSCATQKTETVRTKNLLTAAGFTARKPETPEQRQIYSQMPDCRLEGGLIHGKQLYIYKYAVDGVVYVGGDPEFNKYGQLLAEWKDAEGKILGKKASVEKLSFNNAMGDKDYWVQEYATH